MGWYTARTCPGSKTPSNDGAPVCVRADGGLATLMTNRPPGGNLRQPCSNLSLARDWDLKPRPPMPMQEGDYGWATVTMAGELRRLSPGQVDTVLAAASTGAGWAFDALYRAFVPSVVGYLRAQGAWDPEDLASEVFLAVFKGLPAFQGGDTEFRSWLFSIAHRRAIDDRRRCSRRVVDAPQDHAPAVPTSSCDIEAQTIANLEAERVARLCEQLSVDQRDAILLRLVADLTLEETAQSLGKTTGAVKALQHRGLQALKKVLIQEISQGAVSP